MSTISTMRRYGLSGISRQAWDALCDGEYLATLDIPAGVDPWDGEHDDLAIQLEQDAQAQVDAINADRG
jgi:hypothetical protein